MHKCLTLFALLLCFFCSNGQNATQIRKLKSDLSHASEEDQFAILNDIAWEFRASFPDSGVYYAQKAYSLGVKLRKPEVARSLNFIGLSYYHKGDHLAAYEYFQQALRTAQSKKDSLQLGHANNNIGRLIMEQGLLPKSYDYLVAARNIFDRIHDTSGLAYSLQSLGSYFTITGNTTEAEKNYLEAYRIRLTGDNVQETVSSLLQVGKVYMASRKIDLALKYFMKADSTEHTINDPLVRAETIVHIGECLMIKGDLNRAELMVDEGLRYIQQSKNVRLLPEAYLTMGQVQHKKGNAVKAKEYFMLTLGVATARKDLNTRLDAYFFLWQTSKVGDAQRNEFEHYTNYMTLKDSIRSLEALQRESLLNFQNEIQRRESENEILQIKSERKTAVIVVLAVLILSAIIIVYLLTKNKRRILRVNRLLEERNGEIKKINNLLEGKNTTLEKHMMTLVDFSKNRSIAVGNLLHAAKDIVTITAKKLQVSQVTIWIYSEEKQHIETIACYNLEKDKFTDPVKLSFNEAPAYFEAIKNERIIVANDARNFPATKEFTVTYFIPNNIYSLLDVTFFLDGQLKGLLCCEQQHAIRQWTAEDKIFASSVADIITLAFRTSQRLEYEKHIKDQNRKIAHMNEVLEDRVKQRTEELEEQNKRLAEYAFINSHLLRGPVSRILGLINLVDHDKTLKESEVIELLRTSGNELDQIVKKITEALNDGNYLSVDELRKVQPDDDKKSG